MSKNHPLLRDAAKEIQLADKTLRDAYSTWSESVTSMHMAELHVREAQKRMSRAHDLLTEALKTEDLIISGSES